MSKLVENKSAPCEFEVFVVPWSTGGFSIHTSRTQVNRYINAQKLAQRFGENELGNHSSPDLMLTTQAFFAEIKAFGGTSFHNSLDGLDLEKVS